MLCIVHVCSCPRLLPVTLLSFFFFFFKNDHTLVHQGVHTLHQKRLSFCCQGCRLQPNMKNQGEIFTPGSTFFFTKFTIFKTFTKALSFLNQTSFLVTSSLEVGALLHVFIVKNCGFHLLFKYKVAGPTGSCMLWKEYFCEFVYLF